MTDFSDKVIYQIYPKSFRDSNGDGYGDIGGVIEKLDYLKDLGIDYIWLTPFFLSPQKDNGYDISDYRRIDPIFGSMEDFEELVSICREYGMGVMLDMVFNHTSTEHEWFQKALAGDLTYQDYYLFKEGKNGQPPTNWKSKFGGSAWAYVPELDKWYLHLFDETQADLNWNNLYVREELKDVIRFWRKKGVTGFRFDVINLISKPDVWEDDQDGDGRKFYTDGCHVHTYLKELVRDTEIGDLITVGEMSSSSIDHCIRYTAPQEHEFSMCFHFHHLKVDYKNKNKWELMPPDFMSLKSILQQWQTGMQDGNGWDALFWCNHDQPRVISRFGDEHQYFEESATMLAGLMHLMRGTPYIYQGEEIGMTNHHFDRIEQYKDVESLNYYEILLQQGKSVDEAMKILMARSRDNSRTPMQWNDEQYSGFSSVDPWIDIPNNIDMINVQKQLSEKTSILSFYKKLIQMRKDMSVISRGSIDFIPVDNHAIFAYRRILNECTIIVYCNISQNNNFICLDNLDAKYTKILGNYNSKFTLSDNHHIELKPFEILVLENI
jgi:trehalose-6-phosphate hydrolase